MAVRVLPLAKDSKQRLKACFWRSLFSLSLSIRTPSAMMVAAEYSPLACICSP
jgi:hypothetical protein